MFMGVPRVWEKIKEAVELQVQQTSGFKKWAFDKASVSNWLFCYVFKEVKMIANNSRTYLTTLLEYFMVIQVMLVYVLLE